MHSSWIASRPNRQMQSIRASDDAFASSLWIRLRTLLALHVRWHKLLSNREAIKSGYDGATSDPLLGKAWEQRSPHLRDRLLERHGKTVIESLRADNAILSCIHDKATEARVGWVILVVLGQELFRVNGYHARRFAAFKCFYLVAHWALVLIDSIIDDWLKNAHITCTASEGNLVLNQFDKALN